MVFQRKANVFGVLDIIIEGWWLFMPHANPVLLAVDDDALARVNLL